MSTMSLHDCCLQSARGRGGCSMQGRLQAPDNSDSDSNSNSATQVLRITNQGLSCLKLASQKVP
jgi:hypothetical protein